ncbi:MAG: adenosine kinase [Pirellula sp.]|jgi:sugar/nucleoside kinase (ribokinase family)
MKRYDICGLGNAIVDIFLEVDESEFNSMGFERGTMRLVDLEDQKALFGRFGKGSHELRLVSGGSVANSVIAASQLGAQGAFIGCVGDDRYGLHYIEEFKDLRINMGNPIVVGENTGTCVAIITPDAERTMRTCLGVSSHLSDKHLDEERIAQSTWLFIEGYVFANPDTGQHAIRKSIEMAKKHGTKIAVTCSEQFVPQAFGEAFNAALKQTDLLFCNGPESLAVTGKQNTADAFVALKSLVPHCVLTDGPNGAFVRYQDQEAHVPAFPCHPKDLTGAGDMFAGAFLFGVTHGYDAPIAARGANYLCSKVISQIGARLQEDAVVLWREALEESRATDVGG